MPQGHGLHWLLRRAGKQKNYAAIGVHQESGAKTPKFAAGRRVTRTVLTTEPHAEAAAFAKLAGRAPRPPARLLHARLVGQDHAEDVLQQTMLKAWLAIEKQGVDVESPRAWLFRIAHNQAMDHLRKAGTPWDQARLRELESPESTERAYEALDRLGRVSDGIKGLPVRQRDALLMHSLSGDSYADIATKMNTNVPVISQLITRAPAPARDPRRAAPPSPPAPPDRSRATCYRRSGAPRQRQRLSRRWSPQEPACPWWSPTTATAPRPAPLARPLRPADTPHRCRPGRGGTAQGTIAPSRRGSTALVRRWVRWRTR